MLVDAKTDQSKRKEENKRKKKHFPSSLPHYFTGHKDSLTIYIHICVCGKQYNMVVVEIKQYMYNHRISGGGESSQTLILSSNDVKFLFLFRLEMELMTAWYFTITCMFLFFLLLAKELLQYMKYLYIHTQASSNLT